MGILRRVGAPLIGLGFCLVATMNAGGYRYGVGDQAFYLPAIERHLDPTAFPRDRILIDGQDRLNIFTRGAASVVRMSGVSLPILFAALYVITLLLLVSGVRDVASRLGFSWWAGLGAAAALTLRHRVAMTGANTLEGYMHPRMLAFAVGIWSLALVLRGRAWIAFGLVGVAFLVHPTTALWFGIWVGVAVFVNEPGQRRRILPVAVVLCAAALWAIWRGPLLPGLAIMDREWLGVLAGKDYLFATDWPWPMWAVAILSVTIPVVAFVRRRATGQLARGEAGLLAGAMALATVFLITLPAVHAKVALAVQFQVSRVLWMLDLLATVYVVWFLADVAGRAARASAASRRWQAGVALVLVTAALARGIYVWRVEHPERPIARISLGSDEWQQAMDWLHATPIDTHVLADPGHAWRFGTSVRVAAERDVYLEEVKDTAMSLYSRSVAGHVLERVRALSDFRRLTPDSVGRLDARFDLDYLVTDARLNLPVSYRNSRFTIYALR